MAVVNGDHKKIGKKERTSYRFDLELVSPTQDSFSEFSYLQMVRERKKEVNSAMSGWKTRVSPCCVLSRLSHGDKYA